MPPQSVALSEEETFSFELAQIWVELSEKYFPNYNHTHKRGGNLRSNPKKSVIFKICYKLLRETKGLIEKDDYALYVRAQLEILKIQSKSNPLILVEPVCLVGDQAWKRWKLWKKKYDASIKCPLKQTQIDKSSFLKAKEGILKTKKFIEKNFGISPSFEEFNSKKQNLLNWINFGNISPYYLSVSPYMQKIFSEEDYKKMNFDIKFYKECINDDVKKLFDSLFGYEK
jgi:hypothetical protein